MNINLANIDFVPGQGGGGEAVIRSLDVTENGTYSAPSGVDGYNPVNVNVSGGGSLTPEEQEALDTLVDSSEGVLYTNQFERYHQYKYYEDIKIIYKVFDDLYCINNGNLYKLNKKTYHLDFINHFENLSTRLWGDKSGRLYGNYKELNLEDGTFGQTSINVPEFFSQDSLQNIFYGEYGVWSLGSNNAYKFNESTQEFEQMPLNLTGVDTSPVKYCKMFKYDGHILGVWLSMTFELTEYEDHIDVADVTDVYFKMSSDSYDLCYYTTNDGELYLINDRDLYKYDKSSGNWESISNKDIEYLFECNYTLGLDNFVYCANNNILTYMNLDVEFNNTSWTKLSNVAVDLKSDQKIKGIKYFEGQVSTTQLFVESIFTSGKDMELYSGSNNVNITGNNIIFTDYELNETVVKNGSKQIATVDQTFMNSTFIPYGVDGDNIGYIGELEPYDEYNFNTYTNRLFIKGDPYFNGDENWYEFKGKSKFDLVSFDIDFSGGSVVNSPSMTIIFHNNNTYMWNDENTRWDLLCTNPDDGTLHPSNVWFDGDNFRSRNTYKLVNTDGVWSWVSDPLVNDIWKSYYRFGYKNGEVYAYNDNDWHLYKYDKVNHTMNKIGFINAGIKLFSYFNEMFFVVNSYYVNIIDLSKVDPNNPDLDISGKALFKVKGNYYTNTFIGATDRLWYYNEEDDMCSSYQYIYEKPEVPASDGSYTLKAVRAGDQITYNWVLDA